MLAAAMFLTSFAWSLVYVGLPFYAERVSTVGVAATLAWTGWIMGITPLVAMISGPIGGHFAARGDAKRACVLVTLAQGLGFAGPALADSLLELFLARLALGVVGSASTFAFILVSRTLAGEGTPESGRRRVATIQSALMAGGVLGPLAGAASVVRLGFRTSFLLSALILLAAAAVIQWGVPAGAAARPAAVHHRRYPLRALFLASALTVVAASQESFLAAILPRVLPGLGVGAGRAVEAGGLLIFLSGLAGALGGLAAPHLAHVWHERRLLPALLAASSLLLVALGAVGSLWLYATLRVAQSALVAPLFPLVVARVARFGGGDAIGIVNAARVGSGFLGPVVATTVLAAGAPAIVYLVLGAAGLGAALLLRR